MGGLWRGVKGEKQKNSPMLVQYWILFCMPLLGNVFSPTMATSNCHKRLLLAIYWKILCLRFLNKLKLTAFQQMKIVAINVFHFHP